MKNRVEIFVLKKLGLKFFTCSYLYGGKIQYQNDRSNVFSKNIYDPVLDNVKVRN